VITDVAGVRVGHWTDVRAATGCTVVLLPAGTVASGELRGGAPATREWALLEPPRLVTRLDAVVLTGGSAFGLAACDGVMRFCEERGMGIATPGGVVPIVVGAGLFDLTRGDPTVRPGPAEGRAACEAATDGPVPLGPIGAATGATVGGWRGRQHVGPGWIGSATRQVDDLIVAALVAVNAYGEVDGPDDAVVAPAGGTGVASPGDPLAPGGGTFAHTTLGVVATNATLDKVGCLHAAQAGHDGLARALVPAHSTVDGDAIVAAAVGGVDAPVDQVRLLAARAVEAAVRSGIVPPGGQ
jgi:L-aminopeptidase/D-esterase-like protein